MEELVFLTWLNLFLKRWSVLISFVQLLVASCASCILSIHVLNIWRLISPAVKSITKSDMKSDTSEVRERKAMGEKNLVSRFYLSKCWRNTGVIFLFITLYIQQPHLCWQTFASIFRWKKKNLRRQWIVSDRFLLHPFISGVAKMFILHLLHFKPYSTAKGEAFTQHWLQRSTKASALCSSPGLKKNCSSGKASAYNWHILFIANGFGSQIDCFLICLLFIAWCICGLETQ